MSGQLIVDGYNLARSGALPVEGNPGSVEERDSLCGLLSAYAREKGLQLTIVFDARGSGKPERTRRAFKGGTALYASRSETADDVIRDLARHVSAGTIVVTSDRGLAGTLPSRGVSVVSCEELAERLFDRSVAEIKGGEEDEPGETGASRKKGEGHRRTKQERKRDRLLRKL